MNRTNRHKAKAMAKKPLATPGMPMHTSVGNFSDGKFYWFATEDFIGSPRKIIRCSRE
jgi:hypothetical protein